MEAASQQPINIIATAWTVSVHVVLLLLFFFLKYSIPVTMAPVPESGMEVNLGTDDNGSGTDQPMNVEDPAAAKAVVNYKTAAKQTSEPKELLSTDEKDAPAVEQAVTHTTTPKHVIDKDIHKNTSKRTEQQPDQRQAKADAAPQRPRYVYNGGTGKGGNSAALNIAGGNEGNTFGKGDRGVPNGTPGATNYTGIPGKGTGGISHTLSGRSIVAFPPPDADFREGGKVVIRVTVNKSGVIVNKQVISAGNAELRSIALRKADKIKFNKSDDAPEEQFGNITFVFKTRS